MRTSVTHMHLWPGAAGPDLAPHVVPEEHHEPCNSSGDKGHTMVSGTRSPLSIICLMPAWRSSSEDMVTARVRPRLFRMNFVFTPLPCRTQSFKRIGLRSAAHGDSAASAAYLPACIRYAAAHTDQERTNQCAPSLARRSTTLFPSDIVLPADKKGRVSTRSHAHVNKPDICRASMRSCRAGTARPCASLPTAASMLRRPPVIECIHVKCS